MDGSERGIRKIRIPYSPLPSQKKFHHSKARFKGFSGPIGSGKSQALCQEAIRMSYLNPGRLGFLGAPTYPMLRDATQATLLDILEDDRDRIRPQQGGKHPGDPGHGIEDSVPAGGRVRTAARHEPGMVRAGRADLHAWRMPGCAWKAGCGIRRRSGCADSRCGRLRGYDWVYRKFLQNR